MKQKTFREYLFDKNEFPTLVTQPIHYMDELTRFFSDSNFCNNQSILSVLMNDEKCLSVGISTYLSAYFQLKIM